MLYFPLSPRRNHIRLLLLHPGHETDEIRCDLIHYDLDVPRSPGFEALSYTWGDPRNTSTILLKGEKFEVTKNLEAALRSFRRPPPSEKDSSTGCRLLWVDAICINQRDIAERSEEVLRMRDIYRAAETTIVWLGEANAESDKAMQFMDENKERALDQDPDLLRAGNHRQEYMALVEGLLTRPWWHRMWIVQEVTVSSHINVMCGPSAINWNLLIIFIAIVHDYHKPAVASILRGHSAEDVPNSDLGVALHVNRKKWQRSGPQPLYKLLIQFRTWKATKAVDNVYGLLGMAVEARNPALRPDYKHSPQKVFRTATRFIIEQRGRLDFVCISAGPRTLENLPSWAPDLTVPVLKVPNPLKGYERLFDRYLYSAAKDVPMELSFRNDSQTMNVAGICADFVDCLAPYWDPNRATEGFEELIFKVVLPSWLELMTPMVKTILARYDRESLQPVALAKVLTADRVVDVRWTVSRFGPNESYMDLPKQPPDEYSHTGSPQDQLLLWNNAKKVMIEGALTQRRFLVTKSGYIGLVPELTQEGDVICVLFGCDTPLVLHPVENHYTLVGECYIYGLMDGELVNELEDKKHRTTSFEIR